MIKMLMITRTLDKCRTHSHTMVTPPLKV